MSAYLIGDSLTGPLIDFGYSDADCVCTLSDWMTFCKQSEDIQTAVLIKTNRKIIIATKWSKYADANPEASDKSVHFHTYNKLS